MKTMPKILIADDENDFTANLQTTLSAKAYKVVTASDRMQAQQATLAERPDIIVIGTLMPRGDAFLLHQWLKQTPTFNDLPIIVVDAVPDKRLIHGWTKYEGLQLEVEDYLSKPVEPVSLVPRIEKLLDRTTRVVGEAIDGKDALEKTLRLWPDVVLMDIVMPVMNGLEATKLICGECEKAKVLMLTQYDDEENVLASSQAGALGFVPKRNASSQLLAGIRSVSQGKHFTFPSTN